MQKNREIADPESCLNRSEDDEPLFVLRAKDPIAAIIVRRWAQAADYEKLHEPEKIAEALELADAMDEYRVRLMRARSGGCEPGQA